MKSKRETGPADAQKDEAAAAAGSPRRRGRRPTRRGLRPRIRRPDALPRCSARVEARDGQVRPGVGGAGASPSFLTGPLLSR